MEQNRKPRIRPHISSKLVSDKVILTPVLTVTLTQWGKDTFSTNDPETSRHPQAKKKFF